MLKAEVNGEMIEFEVCYIRDKTIFFEMGTLTIAWFRTTDVKTIFLCTT